MREAVHVIVPFLGLIHSSFLSQSIYWPPILPWDWKGQYIERDSEGALMKLIKRYLHELLLLLSCLKKKYCTLHLLIFSLPLEQYWLGKVGERGVLGVNY